VVPERNIWVERSTFEEQGVWNLTYQLVPRGDTLPGQDTRKVIELS
jgi:hypothetical protein